jgi:hypothetical protein
VNKAKAAQAAQEEKVGSEESEEEVKNDASEAVEETP